MADLIPATGYVAVFSGLDTDGQTQYHSRPLICWTVDQDGHVVGQYLNTKGQVAIATRVPNFSRYMTEDEWPKFEIQHYQSTLKSS